MATPDRVDAKFTVMGQVPMTSADSAFVTEHIATFAAKDSKQSWLRPYVEQLCAIPLLIGWSETIGLRANGEIIRWSTEDDFVTEWSLNDPFWMRVALVEGAKKYSELSHLMPQRPSDARECQSCRGTGTVQIPELRSVICECGGTGWLER